MKDMDTSVGTPEGGMMAINLAEAEKTRYREVMLTAEFKTRMEFLAMRSESFQAEKNQQPYPAGAKAFIDDAGDLVLDLLNKSIKEKGFSARDINYAVMFADQAGVKQA